MDEIYNKFPLPNLTINETDNKRRRVRRWDSSFSCGLPLVSSFTKLIGGECEFNQNIDDVKTSLSEVNGLLGSQNVVLSNFHKVFNIEHLHVNHLTTALNNTNAALRSLSILTDNFIKDSTSAISNLTQTVLCNSYNIHANFLNTRLSQVLDSFDTNYNRFLALFTIDKSAGKFPGFSLSTFAQVELISYGVIVNPRASKFIMLGTERTSVRGYSELTFNGLLPLVNNMTLGDEVDGYIIDYEPLYVVKDQSVYCYKGSYTGLALCYANGLKCLDFKYLNSCLKSLNGEYFCARNYLDFWREYNFLK